MKSICRPAGKLNKKNREGGRSPIRWNKSLRFRMACITVPAMLLLGAVMMLTLGHTYRGQLQRMYVERGSSVAKIAAGLIDGEMIDSYLGSLEKDAAYDSVMRRLNTRRVEHGVQYLYVIKPVEGGAVFVWDTDPENPVGLGEFDEWDASYDAVAGGLLRGERVEPVTLDVKWGYLLVTYEPVPRADGSVAGYVGVDISMDEIMRERRAAFALFGAVTALAVVITAAVSLYVIQRAVIAPVNTLMKSSESFLAGGGRENDTAGTAYPPKLPPGNELAVLERSLLEMERRVTKAITDTAQLYAYQRETLTSILNGMDALICVCDAETFEILFLNDGIRKAFGIEEDGAGLLCYELLQHRDAPCESCPYPRLREEPDKIVIWEHLDTVKNRVLRKTAQFIAWPGGKKAHLEYALDITELRDARESLERQNSLLHTVNQVSAILLQSKAVSFEDDLFRSMGVMGEAVDADRVYIWQNYMKDGELCCDQVYEWSEGAEPQQGKEILQGVSYREVLPSWEEAFLQKRCVNGVVRELADSEYDLLALQGIISILVVPIFLEDQFWGFVGFDDCHNKRVFSENEEKILRSASELIANALIRNKMEKNILRLENEADKIYYDPLTGIYNRRYFDEAVKKLISSFSRSGSELSLMMVDIDFFKRYNDTYGHLEGDNCLKAVAETLRGGVTRAGDFVARYGGEEFVVVLPNTGESGARLIAHRLIDKIHERGIPHENSDAAKHVTFSIGVTSGVADHTLSAADYIKRADEMLYHSKQSGRDRYTFAGLRDPEPRQGGYAAKLSKALAGITKLPVLSSGTLEDAARVIAETGCKTLGTHRIGVWLMDESANALCSVAYYNLLTEEHGVQEDFDLSSRAPYVEYLRSERLLVISDIREPNILSDLAEEYGPDICALLDAPIRVRGELAGVVCIEQDRCGEYPEKREWRVSEQNFVASLADLLAISLTGAGRRKD